MHEISSRTVPLSLLREDESAEIVEFDGPIEAIHRLEEMGLRRGVQVKLVRSGEPLILGLGSQRLSIRLDPNLVILVNPL